MELSLRFAERDGRQATRLIQHLQDRHLEEPGVREALTRMLIDVGLLRPDGTPAFGPGAAPGGNGCCRAGVGRTRQTLDARQCRAERRWKALDTRLGADNMAVSPGRLAVGGMPAKIAIFAVHAAVAAAAIEGQNNNDASPTNGRPGNRSFRHAARDPINLSPNKHQ